jgi:branched-chain amino acid aminotransferase
VTSFWVGNGLVDSGAATVSVLDHGLTVGDGVFETLVVQEGLPFALTRHLTRLAQSAAGMGLVAPDPGYVRHAVAEVVAGGGDLASRGRLRITVTGGPGPAGSDRGDAVPTLIVTLTSLAPRPVSTAVSTVPWSRNENAPTAGVKSTSYADNVVALAYAKARGATEAVFANTAADLCEGTGSNVFVVVGGETLTPPLSSGCLAGVTRGLVLEWLAAVLPIREARLSYGVLATADEVFLTSTGRDVLAVTRIDERELAMGPITAKIAAVYSNRATAVSDP